MDIYILVLVLIKFKIMKYFVIIFHYFSSKFKYLRYPGWEPSIFMVWIKFEQFKTVKAHQIPFYSALGHHHRAHLFHNTPLEHLHRPTVPAVIYGRVVATPRIDIVYDDNRHVPVRLHFQIGPKIHRASKFTPKTADPRWNSQNAYR